MDLSALIRAGAALAKEVRGIDGALAQLKPRAEEAMRLANKDLWGDGNGQETFVPAQAQSTLAFQAAQRLSQSVRLAEEATVILKALRQTIENGDDAESLGNKIPSLHGTGLFLRITLSPPAPLPGPAASTYSVVEPESRANDSAILYESKPLVRSSKIINGSSPVIPPSPLLQGGVRGGAASFRRDHDAPAIETAAEPMECVDSDEVARQSLDQDIATLMKGGRWPDDEEDRARLVRWLNSIWPITRTGHAEFSAPACNTSDGRARQQDSYTSQGRSEASSRRVKPTFP